MMDRAVFPCLIFLIFFSIVLIAPVSAISVSISCGDGEGSTTISDLYSLSMSTALQSESTLDGQSIYQDRQLNGAGDNTLAQHIGGADYASENTIRSSGPLQVFTTTTADSEYAAVSQSVSGTGDLYTKLQGSHGPDVAEQKTVVVEGGLSSTQSLTAGAGISVGQKTDMGGGLCYLESNALSNNNVMLVKGEFYKVDDIKTDLTASSSEMARAEGEVSVGESKVLGEATFRQIGLKSAGLIVNTLFERPDRGFGEAKCDVMNTERRAYDSIQRTRNDASQALATSTSQTYGARSGHFWAWLPWECEDNPGYNRRWNQQNPNIQLYLRPDSNFYNEGLDLTAVCNSIAAAGSMWDDVTPRQLFTNAVIPSYLPSVYGDGISVHCWAPLTDGAIAETSAHYDPTSIEDGYMQITDSDMWYNSDYSWNTNGIINVDENYYDVKTIALHELGHTLGLENLYDKPEPWVSQKEQIMNNDFLYHNHPWLGNGDRTGIWNLYGR